MLQDVDYLIQSKGAQSHCRMPYLSFAADSPCWSTAYAFWKQIYPIKPFLLKTITLKAIQCKWE